MRLSLAFSLLFRRYPHDSFNCGIEIQSKYLTADDLILNSNYELSRTFYKKVNGGNSPFHLNVTGIEDCEELELSTSVLNIHMSRIITPYLISTYGPSLILVSASKISFHIPPENIPGRMSLLVTILLMFINTFNNVRDETPSVSTISYLDAWCMVCIVFITMALGEYAIIIRFRFRSTDSEARVKARCRKLDIIASMVSTFLFVAFIVIYFIVATISYK